jgi:hypothetical protein
VVPQPAGELVKGDGRADMPDMRHALYGRTTVVQAHLAGNQGDEVADFGGCSVVKAQGHRSRLADGPALPARTLARGAGRARYLQYSPILLICSRNWSVWAGVWFPSGVAATSFMRSAIFWIGADTSGATLSATSW